MALSDSFRTGVALKAEPTSETDFDVEAANGGLGQNLCRWGHLVEIYKGHYYYIYITLGHSWRTKEQTLNAAWKKSCHSR